MKPLSLFENNLRQLLERLGSKLDALMSKGSAQAGSARVILTDLLIKMQRAIDENLRKDERGVKCLAPHHLRVLLDYDNFSRFEHQGLRLLETELKSAAQEYIGNRRYKLSQPFSLNLTYDPIVDAATVRADFGEIDKTNSLSSQPAAIKASSNDNQPISPLCRSYRLQAIERSNVTVDLKALKAGNAPVTIGRAQDNNVVLDDNSVSKVHAALSIDSVGRIILADCGSTNGTFINGRPVNARDEARPGDLLKFGDVTMRFEIKE